MKALFDINGIFKTILDVPNTHSYVYYFAIKDRGIIPIYDEYLAEIDYKATKKMVFERAGSDSITIDGKVEYLVKYYFSHFED